MDGADGSDSDRLMAQIEAFLRTGEAPPAAPEPARSTALPRTRPLELEGFDSRAGGAKAPERARVRDRLAGRFSAPVLRTWRRPAAGRHSRLRRYWDDPGWTGRPPDGRDLPRWTPWRAAIVVTALAALLIVPVLISNSTASANPDGLDRASTAAAGPGYSFVRYNPTRTPLRWDPCRAIYYQLDGSAAPAAAADIETAVADISQATGIYFVQEGSSGAAPTVGVAGQPPVEITFETAAQSARAGLPTSLGGGVGADQLARVVPTALIDQVTGRGMYATGTVVIGSAAAGLPAGFVPGGEGVLLLHALGHLVGLGDASDPTEVMNPGVLATPVTAYARGDRAGLTRLGRKSGCLQTPANYVQTTVQVGDR